ncbi:MAG: hypothetical protein IJ574_04320 [Bacilli bacterium]|nr:hypothetical protein [Bacilli bacterium]
MDNLNIRSLEDLYKLILPALKSKVIDLKRKKITIVKEMDIFEYLRINRWHNESNLTLYDIIDDIFRLDDIVIKNYVSEKLMKRYDV